MADPNPCLSCTGKCCRFFRVSFPMFELNDVGGVVPADLVVPITPFRVAMKGTEHGRGACVAQQPGGLCGIYENRPSVCRDFPALVDGQPNPECARIPDTQAKGIEGG